MMLVIFHIYFYAEKLRHYVHGVEELEAYLREESDEKLSKKGFLKKNVREESRS